MSTSVKIDPKVLLAIFTTIIIFILDLNLPLGIAGGVPYCLVILILSFNINTRYIWIAAVVTSALTLIGWLHSPIGGEMVKVLANRFLALFVIWCTAILVVRLIKTKYSLSIEKNQGILKELMIQELHHRVKNNLQVINSLATLQISHSKDEQVKSELRNYSTRVSSILQVHELLYTKSNKEEICISDYINHLVEYLKKIFPSSTLVKLEIELDEVEMSLEKATKLGLVLNEILNNSFKYGINESTDPVITIKCKDAKNAINLTISDNGKGFNPDAVNFSKGIGTELIYGIVKQLKGRVSYTNNPGSTYTIQIPKT